MTILDRLAAHAKERTEQKKRLLPPSEIRRQALSLPKDKFIFENALKKNGLSFICEVKKASPSKGVILETFPYLDIAKEYKAAGAVAISCLTEPFYFQGSDQYLWEIASEVDIPVLRKDFVIDDYMILQAAAYGAAAVLLICALLDDTQLREYR